MMAARPGRKDGPGAGPNNGILAGQGASGAVMKPGGGGGAAGEGLGGAIGRGGLGLGTPPNPPPLATTRVGAKIDGGLGIVGGTG